MTADTGTPVEHDLLARSRAAPPYWSGERLQLFPQDRFAAMAPFVLTHRGCDDAPLNLFQGVGTRHPDYTGMTWLEFLERGRHMPANRQWWADNSGYYTEPGRKWPAMSFISLDGTDWYVDADGEHRTCIARFDFDHRVLRTLTGLSLTDWRFDEVFKERMDRLTDLIRNRRIQIEIEHRKALVERSDNPGWKLDRYVNTLQVVDPAGCLPETLDSAGVLALTRSLSRPRWRRWFRRGGP